MLFKSITIGVVVLVTLFFGINITTQGSHVQPKVYTNSKIHNMLAEDIKALFPDLGAGVEMLDWMQEVLPMLEEDHGYDINEMTINYVFKEAYENPDLRVELDKLEIPEEFSCQNNGFKDKNILQMIAYHGDLATFIWLVETRNMDVNMVDCHNRSLAHHAAWHGHMGIVRYMVENTDFNLDLLNLRVRNIENGLTVLDLNQSEYEIEHPTDAMNSRNLNIRYLMNIGAKSGAEIMYYEDCLSREFLGVNRFEYAATDATRYAYKATNYSCKFALRQLEHRVSKTGLATAVKEQALILAELKYRGFNEFEWLTNKSSIDLQ